MADSDDPKKVLHRRLRSRLLDQYENNLAMYRRVEHAAKAILEYELLTLRLKAAASYQRIEVLSRVKSFGSAFNKIWDDVYGDKREKDLPADDYTDKGISLDRNRDMVGVKVRAFPNEYLTEVERIVREVFPPAQDYEAHKDEIGMRKFRVRLPELRAPDLCDFVFEVQIKPYLIDTYNEIEHGLLYKPRNEALKILMDGWNRQVIDTLRNFAAEFEKIDRDILPLLPIDNGEK